MPTFFLKAMKTIFFILVALHGLIHLLGFVKGFDLKEVDQLTLPISRFMGSLWLTACLLLLCFGISFLLNFKYAWVVGLAAVVLSQMLVVFYWKDAKWGTIPNIIILVVSVIGWGYANFQQMVRQETNALMATTARANNRLLTESDVASLPEPVKRWLRSSGALGRPMIRCGRVTQTASLQMQPGQKNWLPAKAEQYTVIDAPAFIWSVDVEMNSLIRFQGRDRFIDGKGAMLIRLHSLIGIVDEQGEKLDEASLQRFLGEMVWFPSMAVSPYIVWEPIDEHTARATMTYKGVSGSGIFTFNATGDLLQFAAMRYKGNEAGAKRYEWIVKSLEHKVFEGIRVPASISSTWKLDDKDWTWLQMQVTDLQYNDAVVHSN